jgi:nitrogen fixation NifU-like protein
MSEFDQLYRDLILDHYKNPRNYGEVDPHDVRVEGQNPLCGDEVAVTLRLDGETIDDVKFAGQGCAISQAATSMLTELVKGRPAREVIALPREALLDELGVPLERNPARLKCALLGFGVLKMALHRATGLPLPDGWDAGDLDLK